MRSEAFDPFLLLTRPDGTVIAEDNNIEQTLDARVGATLSRSGTYTVWAGSSNGTSVGPYELQITG